MFLSTIRHDMKTMIEEPSKINDLLPKSPRLLGLLVKLAFP
jgi:hypothetical protein